MTLDKFIAELQEIQVLLKDEEDEIEVVCSPTAINEAVCLQVTPLGAPYVVVFLSSKRPR